MTARQDSETILRAIAHADDNSTDLAEGALALAALARPRVGLERYRQHLAVLATDVGTAAASDSPVPPLRSCDTTASSMIELRSSRFL